MSHQNDTAKRKTLRDIAALKGHVPIVCLTSYTAPLARLVDCVADLILVGDSLGMVLYGMESTVPVSLEMMIRHGQAVVRATERAMIVVDMPFGSYQESPAQAFRNAALILKETGAAAVKLEGGAEMAETVFFLAARGIPVMGHIGLQPQSVHAAGGYRVVGRSEPEQKRVMRDARALSEAGAFSLVLECVFPELAAEVTKNVAIPTIGIGASAACDGQILVAEDMLGFSGPRVPKFVRQYAALAPLIGDALSRYAEDVRARRFPAEEQAQDAETTPLKLHKIVS